MTKQALERANKIDRVLENIRTTRHIMGYPYPSFYYDKCNTFEEARFVEFDDDTIKELKDAINNVLDRREKALIEEMEEL